LKHTSTDESLILSYQQGDERAFTELFEKYFPVVYRIFLSKGLRQVDAEDSTIDVFVKLIKGLRSFRFERPFPYYLHRVVRNRFIDFYRQKKTEFCFSDLQQIPDTLSFNPAPATDLAEIIDRCLQQIRSRLRRAILISWIEGYKRSQIAEILGIPLGTVHSNLERGKVDLQNCIQEMR